MNESNLIKLEKSIISKIKKIELGKLDKKESNIGRDLNIMKKYDEHLYNELLERYKKLLNVIK